MWVGSGLFKNFNSLFGTQCTLFGSKCFEHTDWVALPDDAAGYSSTLVDWGSISIMELGCTVFGASVTFLAKVDKL